VALEAVRVRSTFVDVSMNRGLELGFDRRMALQAGGLERAREPFCAGNGVSAVTAGTGGTARPAGDGVASVQPHVVARVAGCPSATRGVQAVVTVCTGTVDFPGRHRRARIFHAEDVMCSVAARASELSLMAACSHRSPWPRMAIGTTDRFQLRGMRKISEAFQIGMTIHTRERGVARTCQGTGGHRQRLHRAVVQRARERCVRVTIEAGTVRVGARQQWSSNDQKRQTNQGEKHAVHCLFMMRILGRLCRNLAICSMTFATGGVGRTRPLRMAALAAQIAVEFVQGTIRARMSNAGH
jgi:hypothetical protein